MLQSISDFNSNINGLINHLKYERNCQLFFQAGVKKYNGNSDFEREFQSFVCKRIKPSLTASKVYSYKNGIISLYGFLERFVEDAILEYLREICRQAPDYASLPSAIKINHLDVSLDHISKIKRNRALSDIQRKLQLREAVKNMNDCLIAVPEYTINLDAFINHSSNFRYDSIHEIFFRIGVPGISNLCLNNDKLAIALSRKHSSAKSLDKKILTSSLIKELNDLAQRRNEIAHGARVDEIESPDLLEERIYIIKKYVNALNEILFNYVDGYIFKTIDKIELGIPSKAYGGMGVLEFEGLASEKSGRIAVGDKIFAVNNDSSNTMLSGSIISLRDQKGGVENLSYPCHEPFCIGVNFDLNSHILKRKIYVGQ
ncbi:MAE_28990/MAE_18760 family HEPN-like nuclease [Marinobacter sp. LV10MA510-1]|uniref:MAE_28990/MAE_18760 family HEPN-like nuclease n=1 Tax=Marinobacter sp. LV10MA510-1 TaxID=1415567 RepID=UPI000BF952F3|nr:MAE_28990/MAE_18760 family HEPN-like nuclease [Marinobacter sp. LV10MA510-1]PFG11120.1 hypothetical protein ATI45_3620 [Marinobacter sp. LV10MA510-1]